VILHANPRILQIGEKDYIGFNFRGDDLAGGVTISSGTVAVAPTSGLTLGSATAVLTSDNTGAFAWVTAVTAGEYAVTFTLTFSDGKILKRNFPVFVLEPSFSEKNILSVEDVKVFLKGDQGIDDELIKQAIEAISARFASHIGVYSLREDTYTGQILDGPGEKYLYLPNWPVSSITSLSEDGTALTEGADYDFVLDEAAGIVERIGTNWINKRKAITITYEAGYTISGSTATLPYALKEVALIEVGRMIQALQHKLWGETSRSFGEGSSSFNTDQFLPETIEALRHFRRLGI